MSCTIHLIDYGLGNLHSVRNALMRVGATVETIDHGAALNGADHIVLPGVGAFSDGMAGLRERGLITPLREAVDRGSRVLGICLGAQLLMSESAEFGHTSGLGILPGRVEAIPAADTRVPNVGWAMVKKSAEARWSGTALEVMAEGTYAYFVHSFEMIPDDPRHVLAYTTSGSRQIVAAVGSRSVLGVQFHPEKSGEEGLRILHRYVHD